ncbi:recombinase family protein [Candidatus Avelusimicrobium alvi]|uniref:recombinase family protein n=1 Tax=Candidatus Avelusimicrobium alvi TaxID=3416221 RepID=UPI003D1002C8
MRRAITVNAGYLPAVQAPGGKPFQKSSIQRILTNPVYLGQVAHASKNKTYKGQHPAILSVEIWEQVQAQLRRRIKSPQAFSGYRRHRTLLSGKLQVSKGTLSALLLPKSKAASCCIITPERAGIICRWGSWTILC